MSYVRSRPVWLGIGLIITNGLFFGLTNPNRVPSIFLMVGFALILMTLYWLVYNLQKMTAFYIPWLSRQKYLTVSIVVCLGMLLALQSIGQLTTRDTLLVPLATLVIYAYTSYGRKSTLAANK